MAGTFVETPSRALTIEHEPTGRDISVFKPEETRGKFEEIDLLASYGLKLRDENKLRELAIAKLETIVDIVDWVNRHVLLVGTNQHTDKREVTAVSSRISQEKCMEILGYSSKSHALLTKWRKLYSMVKTDTDTAVDEVVLRWKMGAGMAFPELAKAKKENEDRDLVVESIFRAYTKLDPDQRIELKQKIMAFEKSYKDPFKDVKEW